jgi:uncharacterized membrane protein
MTEHAVKSLPWLIALTLAALILRLVNLDSGLWLDEIYALVYQYRSPVAEVMTHYAGDNQHPLYAVLASGSISVFGEHNWSIRLPAVLFGVASIPALYFLGAEVSSRREGLLAAALLTFSYHHVWFSQNARGYTALMLCAILVTLLFIRLLRGDPQSRDLWLYSLITALGCYAHLTMVFVIAGHALVFMLVQIFPGVQRGRFEYWRMPFAALAMAAVFTLALYGLIMGQVIDFFVNKPSPQKGISTPMWAIAETLKSLRIGFGAGTVVAAGAVMMVVGLVSYLRTNLVAAGLFVMPALFTVIGAALARGTMYPRFFFVLAGFAILIGVRGVIVTFTWLTDRLSGDRLSDSLVTRITTGAVVVGILVSAVSLMHNYQFPKMDFSGARNWIETRATPSDRIVVAGVAAWPYRNFYGVDWPRVESVADLQRLAPDDGSIWVVYTFPRYLQSSSPDVMAAINRTCVDERRFRGTLGGGDVIVCRMLKT